MHLPSRQKKSYPNKILKELERNPSIEKGNFEGANLQNTLFPEYCSFRNCNFKSSNISHSTFRRINFQGSNFQDSCLKNCHFEYSDFRGLNTDLSYTDARESNFERAILQNTNLTGSDLRDCIFINSDMIGAFLEGAKLYASRFIDTRLKKESFCNFENIRQKNIRIGDEYYTVPRLHPRRPCSHEGPIVEEGPRPLRARDVYNMLMNNFRSTGNYKDERWARSKEREMETKRLFRLGFLGDRDSDAIALERWQEEDENILFESRFIAVRKWFYRLFLSFWGYAESPRKFLILSILTIFIFAFLFLFCGFKYTGGDATQIIDCNLREFISNPQKNLNDLGISFYISLVTFTTLGYGDIHPIGITRFFAAIEALLGLFVYASFVATFLKRISDD